MPVALAVNDDGIDSVGLRVLVRELSERGFRVYVCTPLTQMSGLSKSVSFRRFGRNNRVEMFRVNIEGAVEAWGLNATPAESVLVGIEILMREKPDIVVSGVNIGPNLGLDDFLTSGTIGAALEAAIHGIPGLAVSLAYNKASREDEFRLAARIASIIAQRFIKYNFKNINLISVNVPLNPVGVMVTRLSINNYKLKYVIEKSSIRFIEDSLEERYWDRTLGSDVWAVMNNYISVTPINIYSIIDSSSQLPEDFEEIISDIRGILRE
ncbi:MAG: 5'/3'-nucleotidase SurE [Acidilobaceae archaeon]